MEPAIIQVDALKVLGVIEHFKNASEVGDSVWNKFVKHQKTIAPLSIDKGSYGVYFGEHDKELDYLAGMAVGKVERVTEGLVLREVPAGTYAKFKGTIKTIGDTWGYIWRQWFQASPYFHDVNRPSFDYFPPNTVSADSIVFMYVPVKEKGRIQRT
jgi:predicted transcriptional regulator YdeE